VTDARDAFIRCKGLTKVYRRGDTEIVPLRGLDLAIPRGAFVSLMGPSGSGKTTLLNLLAGIDHATSGELWIDGQDLARLSRDGLAAWRAKSVGIIFQSYNLVPVLTAYENVELPLLLHDLPKRERHARTMAALETVALGRTGAARRHRARDRGGSPAPPRRRTDGRPRPRERRHGARPHRPPAPRAGNDHRDGDA
jgi:ABC-type lipoprotein export system ATPase subunit